MIDIPRILEFRPMMDWLTTHQPRVGADEFDEIVFRVGRNYAPWLMSELLMAGLVEEVAVPYVVPTAWQWPDRPLSWLPQRLWRSAFDYAEFTIDGKTAFRPPQSMTLFRGSRGTLRRRWSWTPDKDLAIWFANRCGGEVFQADVAPEQMLAQITGTDRRFRHESEIVVDTTGLRIARVQIPRSPSS